MSKFTPIRMSGVFNVALSKPYPPKAKKPLWDKTSLDTLARQKLGEVNARGIPFEMGKLSARAHALVLAPPAKKGASGPPAIVPVKAKGHYVCIAHCCAGRDGDNLAPSVGDELARYTLLYADGTFHARVIRRRFEISPLVVPWGRGSFVAETMASMIPLKPGSPAAWGYAQTGLGNNGLPGIWIFAMPNPKPETPIKAVRLESLTEDGIALFAMTLAHFPEHPLRHESRNTFEISLPPKAKVAPAALKVDMDMGHVTRVYPKEGLEPKKWLKDPLSGLGQERPKPGPQRDYLVEATGSPAASFFVKAGEKDFEVSYGEALSKGRARGKGGVRVELCHPHRTWVRVKVVDAETNKPVPTRARFLGPRGEYLPPYGHPADVNTNWFEDEGGNIVLGNATFAYLPGEFQIALPVGDVFVELHKGFEYTPVRRRLDIKPGQRELRLDIRRFTDMRRQDFVTADTHVHFISPQTAWLEGQCEGLNLVNLLASQWGRLFTNVGDITGGVSGCSTPDTLVFVGTENRHHLLGHISMLGVKGQPVFPMCTGGPSEAWFGDADVRAMADWADECRAKRGVVIRPHFPSPNCENSADIVLGKYDALEVRQFNILNNRLDTLPIREWYRYLNCGYRLPAVGGTDKMSAGMPVGGVRTYARLDRNDQFNFNAWGRAVRAGRTFTTSGPLIGFVAENHEVGDEFRMPAGGGTIETDAWAVCAQPIHGLEIVHNGEVVAATHSEKGVNQLSLRARVKITRSGWLAARCFSRNMVWHCWPINVAAHTSPVYVVVGDQEAFSPTDAVYIMTLIHGGMEWLDNLSIKADEKTRHGLRSVFERAERELRSRLRRHGQQIT